MLSISFYVGSGTLNPPGPPRYPLSHLSGPMNLCVCESARDVYMMFVCGFMHVEVRRQPWGSLVDLELHRLGQAG